MAQKKKTSDKLQESLVELLADKPLEDITVTALCEKAGINRATFYYHFDSVAAVFEEVEKNIENDFDRVLARSAFTGDLTPENGFYVTFFEFVAKHATICRLILNSPHVGNSSFLTRAMEKGCSKVTMLMKTLYPGCSKSKIDFYYIFVSNGFLGLLEYWLNSGMRESAEELAEVGEKISFSGLGYLGLNE